MKKRGVFKIKNFLKISLAVARSDFKMNNEGKLFGILWYFINPLIMFFILFLIFSNKKSEILQYPLYLLMGVIMLNFFQNSTVESTRIIGMHGNIIKSVKFKSISLIGALMMENLFMHMIEVIIFIFALFILKASILNIVYYFIVLIFFSFFTFGICLLLSSVKIIFNDLENIWLYFTRLLWFLTPIFYTVENNEKLKILTLFNPLYYFIEVARKLIIYSEIPSLGILEGMILFALVSLMIGLLTFKKLNTKFPERVR